MDIESSSHSNTPVHNEWNYADTELVTFYNTAVDTNNDSIQTLSNSHSNLLYVVVGEQVEKMSTKCEGVDKYTTCGTDQDSDDFDFNRHVAFSGDRVAVPIDVHKTKLTGSIPM